MLKNFTQFTTAIVGIFFISVMYSCDSGRTDEQLKEDITSAFINRGANESYNYSGLTVEVKDGVATLQGECIGNNCVDSAAGIARSVNGVKDVTTNITQKQQETDQTLRTTVQAVISKYSGVQADVANGIVVLRGTINRDQLQPLMNELNSLKAEKIDNQLAILQ